MSRSSQPRDPINIIDSNSPSNKVARARKSTASVSSSSTSDRIVSSISENVEGIRVEHTPSAPRQIPSRNYIDSSRRSSASSSIRPSNSARGAHASSPSVGFASRPAMRSQSSSSRVPKSNLRNSLPGDAVPLGRAHQPQRPRPSAPLVSTKKAAHHSTKSNNAVMTASPSRPSTTKASGLTTTSTTTTSLSSLHNIKQYRSIPPLWQQLDDEFEKRMLGQKRDRSGNMVGFTKRASAARREAAASWGGGKDGRKTARMGTGRGAGGGGDGGRVLDESDPSHINAHIAPRLRLTVGDNVVVDELSDDEPQEREDENIYDDGEEQEIYMPVARKISVRGATGPMPPIRMSSARKIRSVTASSSEESESESESEADSEQLEPVPVEVDDKEGKGTDDEEDELDPDQYDIEPLRDMDGDVVMHTGSGEVEVLPFDEEKMITAPLPPPVKREDDHEPRLRDDGEDSDEGYIPSEALVSSIEALSLSASRMRATRQLPFLRRNVRKGFLERCRWLYVPIYPESQDDGNSRTGNKMRMQVVYETAGSGVYRADVDEWICPVCDLFHQGEEEDEKGFDTREMLDRHLSWDHSEIYYEWVPGQALGLERGQNDSQDENIGYEWQLQLVIPEPEPELQGSPYRVDMTPTRKTSTPGGEKENSTSTPRRSVTQVRFNEDSGIFPYVSLSPPSARLPSITNSPPQTGQPQSQTKKANTQFISKKLTSTRVSTTPVKPKGGNEVVNIGGHERAGSSVMQELEDDDDSVAAIRKLDKGKSVSRDVLSPFTSGSISTSVSGSKTSTTNTASSSRSLTERTSGTPTVGPSMTRDTQPRARSPTSLYPTPPPADAPLGPAARYPYLPASPSHLGDGGGPAIDENIAAVPNHITGTTISYSCRPGPGPYLFDILDTLPLAQYGVLSWEVLDREDEIWESDDVKEEYKVMHALWARWIFLPANRNKFIANYLKGVKAFIDTYWRIIHKAAGWSALRYFLFILLANHFLSGHDVAQVLLYYENLTGMENWTT